MTAEQQTWAIRLPLAKPLNMNDRKHWAIKARETRGLRDAVCLLARSQRIPLHVRIQVGLDYWPRQKRTRDAPNLLATMKPAVDGLVDARAVVDDSDAHVVCSMPVIHPPDRGDPRIVLIVHGLEVAA